MFELDETTVFRCGGCGVPFKVRLPTSAGDDPVRPSFCPFCGSYGATLPGWAEDPELVGDREPVSALVFVDPASMDG